MRKEERSGGARYRQVIGRVARLGMGAVRAVLAVAVASTILGGMAWVTSGRLDATWPARNVLEARVTALARQATGGPILDERLPGAIVGRVTARVTEVATPEASPLAAGEMKISNPPAEAHATARAGASSPAPAPTLDAASTALTRHRDVGVPGAVVLVVDADGNAVETRTDPSGMYALSGLSPGRYRVVVAAPGFAPAVIDRPPGASHVAQLIAWVLPGVSVPSNGDTTLAISVERPTPPAHRAFARDVYMPRGSDPGVPVDLVACDASLGSSDETPPVAWRLPVSLTEALADAPVASVRRYAPAANSPHSLPAEAQATAKCSGEACLTQPRVAPSLSAYAPIAFAPSSTAAVVAVVPVGAEEDMCGAITLASRGVEVVVVGIAPDARAERQVLVVRTILAAMRARTAPSSGGASIPPPTATHGADRDGCCTRGPVVLGAGYASAIAMRAIADEAAEVPTDWSGVAVSGTAVPDSAAAERIAGRRAAVARRVGGIVLVSPVLDLFAARRSALSLGLPAWLAQAVVALGPADRELPRYVRYSARFAADIALPPVVLVRPVQEADGALGAVNEWARMLGSVGVAVEVMSAGENAPNASEVAVGAVVERVVSLANAQ